jgi:hypothetical protein
MLEEDSQGYILTILQYITLWDNLQYAYVMNTDGTRLSEVIGPKGTIQDSSAYSTQMFVNFERIIGDYLSNNNFGEMLHLRIELDDELLLMGTLPGSFLIVSLLNDQSEENGKSRLSERVKNLKTILSLPKE